MAQTIKNYTFDKTAKTITFVDFDSIELEHVQLITNVTSNVIIYQFNNPAKGGSVTNNVLTLDYDTSAMANTDDLAILYVIGETGPKHLGVNDNVIGKIDQNMMYFEDDFPGTGAVDATKWTTTTGTGMTVTKSGGALAIAAGITAGSVTTIRSKKQFIGAMTLRFTAMLSQRIANQNFYLELTDGTNNTYAQWDFSGTVNTTARTGTMNQGNGLQNAATVTNATSAHQTFEIQRTESGIQFSTNTINTNTTNINRANMTYGLPEIDLPLYVQIRVVNGGTAPATSTTLTVERVSVVASNAMKVAVEKGAGNQSLINAISVAVINALTATVSGTVTSNAGTAPSAPWGTKPTASTGTGYTAGKLISAATTNATVIKASAGTLGFIAVSNLNAAVRYLKIYNKATAPTVGTDIPVQTYLIPANGSGSNLAIPVQGLNLATGIGIAITTGVADNDTGAVAAGEIVVNYGFI